MSSTGFAALLEAALVLDRHALAGTAASMTLWPAWAIAFVGGVSLMLGQSIVLFANRVSRRRFLACLLVASVIYVVGLIIWAATIWLVARFVFKFDAPIGVVTLAVCLGQAPRVFGFLILIPYFGASIHRFLDAYSLVVVVAALSAMLGVGVWTAFGLALGGWAIQAGLDELLHRPLAGVRNWLWRASTGRSTPIRPRDVAAALSAHAQLGRVPEERSSAG